jgi:uncharacterized MAPEG superfamily protein
MANKLIQYLNNMYSLKTSPNKKHFNIGAICYLIGSLIFYFFYMRTENIPLIKTIVYLFIMIIISLILVTVI